MVGIAHAGSAPVLETPLAIEGDLVNEPDYIQDWSENEESEIEAYQDKIIGSKIAAECFSMIIGYAEHGNLAAELGRRGIRDYRG